MKEAVAGELSDAYDSRLVDEARHRLRDKRGGGARPETLDDLAIPAPDGGLDAVETASDVMLAETDETARECAQTRRPNGLTALGPGDVAP